MGGLDARMIPRLQRQRGGGMRFFTEEGTSKYAVQFTLPNIHFAINCNNPGTFDIIQQRV